MMSLWETSKGITPKNKLSKSAKHQKMNLSSVSSHDGHHTTVARSRPINADRENIRDTWHENDDLIILRPKEPQKEQPHEVAIRWANWVNEFIIFYEYLD